MAQITAFIGSLGGGGAQGVFVTVMNYYVELGYRINAVVSSCENDIYSKKLNNKIKLVFLNADSSKKSFPKIVEYVKSNDIDLAFAFSPELAVNIVMARTLSNKKFYIVGRCINTLSYEYSHADGFFRKYITNGLVRRLYKKSNYVIAQADCMRKDLIKCYGFAPNQVFTINNPLADKYCDVIKQKPFMERDNYILYVGRFEKQKGLEMLVDAFDKLKNSNDTGLRLLLIGKGSLEEKIKKEVETREIAAWVDILPFQENIEEYYKRAKITVLCSYFEGFPNVLSESIACGTPVVSYDLPSGPSDIIIEGENGYLAEYLNVDDLVDKIRLSLNTTWDYMSIKKSALRFCKKNILPQYDLLLKKMEIK